jgi:hypothetical protein
MASASAFDLVWHVVHFYFSGQQIAAIAMALDRRHCSRACLQRIGWYTDAASDVGFGLSLVFVVILFIPHASLGLAVSFAFGLADLPSSLLA